VVFGLVLFQRNMWHLNLLEILPAFHEVGCVHIVKIAGKSTLPQTTRWSGVDGPCLSIHWVKCIRVVLSCTFSQHGGTAMAVPPPFRLGDPDLCGSHPLVTPVLV